MKQIIYIMGGGRVGSTILDIILGNNPGIVSCGELRRFATNRGLVEHRFPGDPCVNFWSGIRDRLADRLGTLDFSYLDAMTRKVEYHTRFLSRRTYQETSPLIREYTEYTHAFLDVLFEAVQGDTIVDSSKYPGRALALYRILDMPVKVIYLVRHPVGVVRSFSKSGIEQPRKGFWSANLYYGVNGMLCGGVFRSLERQDRVRVRYEDLVYQPAETLRTIASTFQVDLSRSIDLLQSGSSLKVGCLCDGNRLRKQQEVTLDDRQRSYGWGPMDFMTRVINRIWY